MGYEQPPAYIDPAVGGTGLYSLLTVAASTLAAMALCFALVWLTYRDPAPAPGA